MSNSLWALFSPNKSPVEQVLLLSLFTHEETVTQTDQETWPRLCNQQWQSQGLISGPPDYSAIESSQLLTLLHMDEPHRHYAKGKKPDMEDYIFVNPLI